VLRQQLRVQGEAPRDALLREHRAAVDRGERSILVGLQSFGEGLDLPGQQCEWVFVPKLPFASPDDPVAEARAEWLQAQGRSPFNELVVPATGVRLNQWAGRGIRSETDHATLVCYDGRLSGTPFGRQLLAGLPGFRRSVRGG
jgi:ATP-dependent DNA helicase DinG